MLTSDFASNLVSFNQSYDSIATRLRQASQSQPGLNTVLPSVYQLQGDARNLILLCDGLSGLEPVKAGYSALDDRLTAAIHLRFGLPAQIPKTVKTKIKRADRISAWLEATQIAGFSIPEANKLFGRPNSSLIKGLSIVLRAPIETRHAFVDRHEALLAQL